MAVISSFRRPMMWCGILVVHAVTGLQHGLAPSGIAVAKEQKVVLEPTPTSFDLGRLVDGGAVPEGLESWAHIFKALGKGQQLRGEALEQMMDTSGVGGDLSAAYVDPGLRSELGNKTVRQQIQNLTGNTELLLKAVQEDPMVQQLAAISPAMAEVISNPDALRKILSPEILEKVRSGTVDGSMQGILDLATGEHSATQPMQHVQTSQSNTSPTSPSVLTLEDGLRLKQVRAGDAKSFPRDGDQVRVYYAGYLMDGKLFDHGTTSFEVGAGQVIRGWDVALKHMSLGERAALQVPAGLGYGGSGQGPIPPDADLIFDVDLRAINKLEAQPLAV